MPKVLRGTFKCKSWKWNICKLDVQFGWCSFTPVLEFSEVKAQHVMLSKQQQVRAARFFGRRSPELISPLLTHITLTRTSLCKCFLDQIVPDSHINSPRCLLALSAAGSEGLVHQPQHGDREERPLAHRGGPGGLSVRTVTAGSSDWSPQLLQECLQVGNSSPGDGWRLRFSYTED